MMNEKEITRISKFLSLVLRHQPETIGLTLDEAGWADIDELIEKANGHDVTFDRQQLDHIVASNAKKRFAFNDTLDKIRASQGHSIAVELGYKNQQPPEILFHGTGEQSVEPILASGLVKQSRQHVHMSPDRETAVKVGQRHGKPYVFEVDAGKMFADGFAFFISENGVWLTDYVPTKYLKPS